MKPKIESLESERLALEVRKGTHAEELYDSFCEKELYHYICRDIPPSLEWLRKGMTQAESLVADNDIWLGWVGRDKSSLKPIGLFEITIVKNEAFVAYTVLKDYWGCGYTVEATEVIMDYIAKNYEISRFIIEMDTRNRASVRVAEKLGFKFVKVMNNAAFLKNFVSHEFQFEKTL